MFIHQGMITARTADLHRKDSLIGGDIYPVESDLCSMDDVTDLLEHDIGKIVAVDYHDGPKGASSETIHCFEGDLLVGCGLPGLNAEVPLERLRNA
jgi:hypothetical protein